MNPQTNFDTLLLDTQAGWLTIWLNRPEARNALSARMVAELMEVLERTAQDPTLRGVTIRGRGGVFCAGGDIKDFKNALQHNPQGLEGVHASSLRAGELFERINTLPQVVLMRVEGPAMAGGMGMVCAGDVVAASADATFALTEVTLGIPPAQIAPYVVNRLGLRTARRLMLTAARFDAQEALRLGLTDHVASDAQALDAFEASLKRAVARCAPGANAATKDVLLATQRLNGQALREHSASEFARCMLAEEGREGVSAFLEKRKPRWAT